MESKNGEMICGKMTSNKNSTLRKNYPSGIKMNKNILRYKTSQNVYFQHTVS